MNNLRQIFRLGPVLVLALMAIHPSAAKAAEEFVAAEFLTRAGELRAVFQLSGANYRTRDFSPAEGKLVVQVSGLCRQAGATSSERDVCNEGPVANLQALYRFARSLPARQLNVVDLGTGEVQLIWRLQRPGIPTRVDQQGDRLEVVLGASQERLEASTGRSASGLVAPSTDASSRIPAAPSRSAATAPPPKVRVKSRLAAPDPAFLDQDRGYKLGVGDRIQLVVHADDKLSREALEVAPTGYVDLPLVGPLPVAGHSVRDVEIELERLLGENFLRDPDVTLLVEEYNSQWVNVMGAVGEGGRVPLKGKTTLMDALTEAGGSTDEASGNVIIHRRGETDPIRVRLDDLLGGFGNANVLLVNGDTVNVERKKPFYVSGEVKNPGKYEIEPGMTLLDAIAIAGGMTEYAKEKQAIIIRSDRGERVEITVNPKAIENGKEKNLEVMPGDHIKIPGSFF